MRSTKNVTRAEIFAANKRAFTDIFGDPFAWPEPVEGHYQNLKSRGVIAAMKNNFDEGRAARLPGAPTLLDFFCDVENIVSRNLEEDEQRKFNATYILESGTDQLSGEEKVDIEQRIGRILKARKISPTTYYFRAIRQRTKTNAKRRVK